ncbi:MAG: hypothetical protein HY043_22335 [Verrucomicrobia bacterium]|nr:hypothetical protein [Verrucomicrobiota bacterium]
MAIRAARWLTFVTLFLCGLLVTLADETITVPKARLQELERKAADADRLATELSAAKAEIARLKGEQTELKKAAAKPARWLPPAVEKAEQKQPPTPPIHTLPPLAKGEVVSIHDLLNHYASDVPAADLRFRKQIFRIRGIVTDVNKELFVSPYRVIFRLPEQTLRVVCEVRPSDEFTKVYVAGDHERVVGEKSGRAPITFISVGDEITYTGRCVGLRNGVVSFENCEPFRAK